MSSFSSWSLLPICGLRFFNQYLGDLRIESSLGSDINDLRAFRVPLYIGLAVPTLVGIFELLILVESPSWLLMRGKREQARKSLNYIYSWQKDTNTDILFAELEYTLAKEAEMQELQNQSSYLDCFKRPDLRRTFCACFPTMSSNLAGNNLNGQYATCTPSLQLATSDITVLTLLVDFFQIAGSGDPLVNSVITSGKLLLCI